LSAQVSGARPTNDKSNHGGHGGQEEKSCTVSGLNLRVLRVLRGRSFNNRQIVLAWAALLCAVLFWQTSVRAARPDGIDLTSYLLSARALMDGGSPYLLATPFPYLYPPTLAFLLVPLTLVPPVVALIIWFALNAIAAVWAIRKVVLFVSPELEQSPDQAARFLAMFFTFFFPIVQSNLRNGQVNFLVLALSVAAALPGRCGLPYTGAGAPPPARTDADTEPRIHMSSARCGRRRPLFWALAVAIKIVPLVLIPYFALRRQWRYLLLAGSVCVAFLLLPGIVVGDRIIDIYRQYSAVLLASSFGQSAQPLDFSLAGMIAGVTGTPATPALRISAAAVVVGWILQRDGRRLRHEHARPFALYLLGIPLASPKSEVHHLAFMLPAAAVTAAGCWRPSAPRSRAFLIAAASAALLYVAAATLPSAKGLLYCAALIVLGLSLIVRASDADRSGV
jgi:Glycosyltransferase family 87